MKQLHSSVAFALAIVLLSVPAHPQSVPSSQVSANDLARRVITNELRFQDDHSNWMYRLEKEQYGKKQVEEIIETKEGSLSRLLSINDHSLTAKQQEEEDQRVQALMTSQSAKRKLQRVLDAETLQGRRLFKMLPDAFVFDYAVSTGFYCSFAYSALACFRMGMSGSPSFQTVRKSWYAVRAFAASPCMACARASPSRANPPGGRFLTAPQ